MLKVHENISVGMIRVWDLFRGKKAGESLLNLSSKYHYKLLGWTKGFNYQDDPNYIMLYQDGLLSVNWVDADARFYDWKGQGVQVFNAILDFIGKELEYNSKVYICCDKGQSRSPSVALLYLAKRLHVLPDTSFEEAREKFLLLYPMYNPGGIKDFISEHWEEIK